MKFKRIFPLLLSLILIFSVLTPTALAVEPPVLNGKAAVILDLEEGTMLYGFNENEQRAVASLTKLMTVLLAVEAIDSGRNELSTMVTAQDDCLLGMEEDSSTSGILPGMEISMDDLLYCALLQSANEACNIIGRFMGGTIDGFVEQMNIRAQELGCVNTHFVNTNGLPAEDHYSSAYDMALILREALKHPLFEQILNTTSHQLQNSSINGGQPIGNSNALINITSVYSYNGRYLYEGAKGGKTGYTRAAGYCLASYAMRNGVSVIAVVLGCDGPLNQNIDECFSFVDSRALFDWTFSSFSYRNLVNQNESLASVHVDLAEGDGDIMLYPQAGKSVLLPNELPDEAIRKEVIIYDQRLTAPLAAGTVLGEIRISADGADFGSIKLTNISDVELSRSEYLKLQLKDFLSKGWVITLILGLLIFALIYLVLVIRYRKLRRKHLMERRRAEEQRKAKQAKQAAVRKTYTVVDPSARYEFEIKSPYSEAYDDETDAYDD